MRNCGQKFGSKNTDTDVCVMNVGGSKIVVNTATMQPVGSAISRPPVVEASNKVVNREIDQPRPIVEMTLRGKNDDSSANIVNGICTKCKKARCGCNPVPKPTPIVKPTPKPDPINVVKWGNATVVNTNDDILRSQGQIKTRQLIFDENIAKMNAYRYRSTANNGSNSNAGRIQAETSVNGATTKIRLVLTLQKLNSMSVPYSMVSQYFDSMLKELGPNHSNTNNSMFFQSILVFDRDTLKDSNACYNNAINSIRSTQSTDYSLLTDIVDGLSSIVTDLR